MAAATPGGPVRGSAPQFKGSRELVRWSDELVRGSSECTKMEKFWENVCANCHLTFLEKNVIMEG